MNTFYTSEKNTQILIALMKAHGIRKIVASPGATNVCLVASLQQDPYFEIYSSVDERSAAYIACGLAAESNEAVALSCTGATASRNYIPGLTEAYYRKLPILAITSTQNLGRIGQNYAQVIDRTVLLNDIARMSVQIPEVVSEEDSWVCERKINQALLELRRGGGGPVHINLVTTYSRDFSVQELPKVRVIRRVTYEEKFPELKGKVVIFVGNHSKWSEQLTKEVDEFCEKYDSYVLCDHTSNYRGKYKILTNLVSSQQQYISENRNVDILLYIGNISGTNININARETWRIHPDGEIRDLFKNLTYVFEMKEESFFRHLNSMVDEKKYDTTRYCLAKREYLDICQSIPELPFSNAWIAQQSAKLVPADSVLHLGILNTLRCWNFFEVDNSVAIYSNTGGFGIDGNMSSLIGASLSNETQLYFGIVGDLSFFYDMNVLGNRSIGPNVRVMLINNGRGTEFRNYNHPAAAFGEDADYYMAAAGHYGNKSPELVKHYATDLGFTYLTANDKNSYLENAALFFDIKRVERPVVFEVFTNSALESEAIKIINNAKKNPKGNIRNVAKEILGESGMAVARKILGK